MEDDKWPYHISYRDDEDRIQYFLTVVFEGRIKPPPEYSAGVLIKSIERLKASTDKNFEGLQDLKATTEKSLEGLRDLKAATDANLKGIETLRESIATSSSEANNLARAIKKLNAWLVGLTIAAVALAGISLYVLIHSAK